MLEDKGIEYQYREYRKEPLDQKELRRVLKLLGVGPKVLLRRRDKAFRELGLTGEEPDADLIRDMAAHPTLLERPIGVLGDRAVVGRPPEKLL
ncbi:MAG: arsenate reductase (glutaredoxin), partial [Acidobacteriota bacterium]|nr:arsenate reductase (glutaredoxin) [Acidobacteriota bacterium]